MGDKKFDDTRMSGLWLRFEALLAEGQTARDIGFHSIDGDVSRFLARYKVGWAFRGVELSGFTPTTTHTYSALLRLFLVWSAFESYCKVAGLTKSGGGLSHDRVRTFVETTSTLALPPEGADCRALREFLFEQTTNSTLRKRLLVDSEWHPYDLCQALRHSFVHGPLTAHAGGTKPAGLRADAEILSSWLLSLMAEGFAGILEGPV